MPKIAVKPGFMKMTAVKVCTKAGTGSNRSHRNPGFFANLSENSRW
jgi:hypothetical protein